MKTITTNLMGLKVCALIGLYHADNLMGRLLNRPAGIQSAFRRTWAVRINSARNALVAR